MQAGNKRQKYEKISEKKMSTPVEVLCKVVDIAAGVGVSVVVGFSVGVDFVGVVVGVDFFDVAVDVFVVVGIIGLIFDVDEAVIYIDNVVVDVDDVVVYVVHDVGVDTPPTDVSCRVRHVLELLQGLAL